MKKIISKSPAKLIRVQVAAFFVFLFMLSSCYDDYLDVENKYNLVYFPKKELARSAIAGEGLNIKIGVIYGGVKSNDKDVSLKFQIDNSLLGTKFVALPTSYYTLSSPDKIVIPKGSVQGFVDVQFNEEKFKNDPLTLAYAANTGAYAIALRIIETDADSINANFKTTVIPVKYINTYEGNYFVYSEITKPDGTVQKIGDLKDYVTNPVRAFSTTSFDQVTVVGIADQTSATYKMSFKVDANGTVAISPVVGSLYQVSQDGECKWDKAKRWFTVGYQYTTTAGTFKVKETMIFRNRMRDGISEWRWDGFVGN